MYISRRTCSLLEVNNRHSSIQRPWLNSAKIRSTAWTRTTPTHCVVMFPFWVRISLFRHISPYWDTFKCKKIPWLNIRQVRNTAQTCTPQWHFLVMYTFWIFAQLTMPRKNPRLTCVQGREGCHFWYGAFLPWHGVQNQWAVATSRNCKRTITFPAQKSHNAALESRRRMGTKI